MAIYLTARLDPALLLRVGCYKKMRLSFLLWEALPWLILGVQAHRCRRAMNCGEVSCKCSVTTLTNDDDVPFHAGHTSSLMSDGAVGEAKGLNIETDGGVLCCRGFR